MLGIERKTIAEIRVFSLEDTKRYPVVYTTDIDREGLWQIESVISNLLDNTGTILVTSSGFRYKRLAQEHILSSWFEQTDIGFQEFLNVASGRLGIINKSITLSTQMNIPSLRLQQRRNTTVTSSAQYAFKIKDKKFLDFEGVKIESTYTGVGAVLWIDGLWYSTFQGCDFSFNTVNTNTDIINITKGSLIGSEYFGTYYVLFENLKTAKGRNVFNMTGNNVGLQYITNVHIKSCWSVDAQRYIKAEYVSQGIVRDSSSDLTNLDTIDLTNCDQWEINSNEMGSNTGVVIKQTNCNRNVINQPKTVYNFTSNGELTGLQKYELQLQGSNNDSDPYRARIKSQFNYGNSFNINVKGGSSWWTEIMKWGEAGGLELFGGFGSLPITLKDKVGIKTNTPTSDLSVNGTADKVGGGVWGTFSDKKLKTDIKSVQQATKRLLELTGIEFKYNGYLDETGKTYYGFDAENFKNIYPSFVEEKEVYSLKNLEKIKNITENFNLLFTEQPSNIENLKKELKEKLAEIEKVKALFITDSWVIVVDLVQGFSELEQRIKQLELKNK